MPFHIRWRIALPYIFLILFVMTMTAVYLAYSFQQQNLDELGEKFSIEAALLADHLSAYEGDFVLDNDDFDEFAETWSNILNARITIISPGGVVVGESQADRYSMGNHLDRPEVQSALQDGYGRSVRYSQTEGKEFMYTAVPIRSNGQIKGFVRIAITTEQIRANTAAFIQPIILITIVALILAIILATVIAEYISRPIRKLTEAVNQITIEDLELAPITISHDELGQLANAFDVVVSELNNQIKTLEREQKKLDAVLKQLTDGVMIVDESGIIQMINPAAQTIFNVEGSDVLEHSVAAVTRQHEIVNLWKNIQDSETGDISSIEISTGKSTLQVLGIPLSHLLPGSSLLVFHDMTRIRHLETVRRDFISNISHELRTPLASLKALTETLQQGALDDAEVATRFLNQIDIEIDSLSLIVQELLELSRIESGKVPLILDSVNPCEIIANTIDRLKLQAEMSELALTVDCKGNLPNALVDSSRMEQVLVNILHNAIKFTPAGGWIRIACVQVNDELEFSVSDSGEGISSDDFPRIFERFYKADRSRAGGGTGLGLAISKHLVEAHNGKIWAESIEGRGSTFFFTIPISD